MFTEAQNFAIVQTELDSVFYQEFNYTDSNPVMTTCANDAIFKQTTIDRAAYIEEVFKGVGLFTMIGETQTVPLGTPKVANKLTTYIKDFAQGVELSKDLFDDNLHGVWARAVSDLALKARVTMDDNAFKIFRGGFTTTLTADGSALFSSHTLIGGGTVDNSSTAAMSPAAINTGIIHLAQQKDQSGTILGQQPAVLLVPPALIKKALEYTDSALVADQSTNNINVYRSAYGFRVYSNPYLGAAAGGSDTAWFMLARNHGIRRIVRQGVQTALRNWDVSNNRTYFYQANFREEAVAVDYVGAFGSTGTVV